MHHLIVFAHPNPKSFSATILDHIQRLSEDLGNTVSVRDLYKMKFNPVLSADDFSTIQNGMTPKDVETEQSHVAAADLITLIFPLWWSGYPAILKGWIDRVLLHGFAFKYSPKSGTTPLLTGKKVQIITTMGASVEEYENNGLMDAMAMTMGDNVWSYCGLDDAGMVVLGEIPQMSDQERIAILGEIEDTLVLALASSKNAFPLDANTKKAKIPVPSKTKATPKSKKPTPKKPAPKKKPTNHKPKAKKKSPAKKSGKKKRS
jgi:NAD(P)H dehydrogenase (quinone)